MVLASWQKCLASSFSILDLVKDHASEASPDFAPSIYVPIWLAGICITLETTIRKDSSLQEHLWARIRLACAVLRRMSEAWPLVKPALCT